METDLGIPAEEFYENEVSLRSGPVTVARRLADLTVPSLFPPEEWNSGDDITILNQSINARCVNTLSTKLTQVALPPNLPFVKFTPVGESMEEDIKADPGLWSEVQYALSRREQTHRERLETTTARSAYGRSIRLQLVTGNSLTIWTELDKPVVYNMHSYVVKRSEGGTPLVTVAKTSIAAAEADEDILEAVEKQRKKEGKKSDAKNDWEDEIDIYHVQKLITSKSGKKQWLYWQEAEGGYVIPDTEAYADYDVPHMYPAGLIHEPGSDWYLPYSLDYEGDIQAVETFAASLQDGAAAMAWFLFFVDPLGETRLKDVQEADSLDVLKGRAQDVTVLQANKGGDYQGISNEFQEASRRLGYAFAMHTSVQRSGERVTAEEWKIMARELNETMGGLYSDLATGYQRWFVLRFIHLHQLEDKSLKALPEGSVKVGIMNGVESIGQDTDLTNLLGWASEAANILGPEQFAGEIDRQGFLKRHASLRAIKLEGLLKSPDQKAAEDKQNMERQQQQTLLEQGTGPVAKEGAAAMAEMLKQQQGDSNG
jgi:hypothetical protein